MLRSCQTLSNPRDSSRAESCRTPVARKRRAETTISDASSCHQHNLNNVSTAMLYPLYCQLRSNSHPCDCAQQLARACRQSARAFPSDERDDNWMYDAVVGGAGGRRVQHSAGAADCFTRRMWWVSGKEPALRVMQPLEVPTRNRQ